MREYKPLIKEKKVKKEETPESKPEEPEKLLIEKTEEERIEEGKVVYQMIKKSPVMP